ncbi:MAG: hypothetical protein ACI9LD_000611 [Polaromonas sp.]|jgi:hypothetical protein
MNQEADDKVRFTGQKIVGTQSCLPKAVNERLQRRRKILFLGLQAGLKEKFLASAG